MTNKVVPISRMAGDEKDMWDDDGEERITAELLADIMRLAKECEQVSGQGHACVVIRAREESWDLNALALMRDGLMDDLAIYKGQRRERRDQWLSSAIGPAAFFLFIGAAFLLLFFR